MTNDNAHRALERERVRRKADESQRRIALAAVVAIYRRHNDREERKLLLARGGAKCEP